MVQLLDVVKSGCIALQQCVYMVRDTEVVVYMDAYIWVSEINI